jgi:hypothetical protein
VSDSNHGELDSMSNFWFETESGDIHFIAFQVVLDMIWRYAANAAERLRGEVDQALRDLESAADAMDFAPLPVEADLAERLLPTLTFGGATAAALTALECLLVDLCTLIEDNAAEFSRTRRSGDIENYLAYLSKYADFRPEIPKETWREFDTLRRARNRFAHQLGAGAPADLAARIDEITSGTAKTTTQGEITFTVTLVKASLATAGQFGRAIEDAFMNA